MEDSLKNQLSKFKEITLKAVESLNKDEFDLLIDLLNNRENVISEINKISYTKEEFSQLCKELEIMESEKRLSMLINEKKDNLKIQMGKISIGRAANKSYNKNFYDNIKIFSKKI